MKWLGRLLAAVVLVLLLLVVAAGLLLGTNPGVKLLLQTADRLLPGTLQVEQVQGNLLGDLELRNLGFTSEEVSATVERLVLSWLPGELFSGRFHVRELAAEGVSFEQLVEKEEEPPEPLELPDIRLPVDILLDKVQVTSVKAVTAPGAEPLVIDRAGLQAVWGREGIRLSDVTFEMPQVKAGASGQLQPVGDYPLALQLQWALQGEALPKLRGQGKLEGELKKRVQLAQRLSGDVQASLDATVRNLLEQLGWEAKIQLTRVAPQLVGAEVPEDLQVTLKASGDLEKAHADILLQATPDTAAPKQKVTLKLLADLLMAEQRFDVKGDWSRLQWPLAGSPRVSAESGTLALSGVPEDYRFTLQAKNVHGEDVPQGDWLVKGQGNLEQLVLEGLSGETLDGRLEASGKVFWQPALGWDLQLSAAQIDPGSFHPDWPGRLDLKLVSKATTRDGKLHMETVLSELRGELNEKPVSGSGTFRMAGDEFIFDRMVVATGGAKLEANGKVGRQWDLQWRLDVSDLADLLPGGQGSVQGEGKLEGTAEKPVVRGQLAIRELVYQATRLPRADVRFALGLDSAFDSELAVNGSDLRVGGQKIESLNLAMQGPIDRHRITLALKHEMVDLDLAAGGGYQLKKAAWEGEVESLALTGEQVGNWNLESPSKLSLSAQKVSVTPLCLQDGQAKLCVQADRFPEKGNADLTLEGLALERFRELLPPEIEEFSGMLHAKAHVDLKEPLKANLEAVLEPGQFVYLDPQARPVRLEHRNGKLTAVLDEKALAAQWHLELGEHRASGELQVPRDALDKDPTSAPLTGKVDMKITELSLLKAFVPDIQEIDGKVDVALVLGGTLGEPRITGHALLEAQRVVIPRAGLELREVLVRMQGSDGRTLKLDGRVLSGEGEMKLAGEVLLDAEKGWPARIELKGDRFQVANVPEAQVIVSTDMKLESDRERILLRGKLDVNRALIEIHDLPPGTEDVSPDAVIVGEEEEVEQVASSKLDAEVVIDLGDQVHFAGFGLNVDLGGKLTTNMVDGKLPTANGELKILSGSYRAYGQDLTIEQGRISWAGGNIKNPNLRLQASRRIDDIVVGVRVTGTARKPSFTTYSSDPDVTEKEALSLLLTGQKGTDLAEASIYAGRQITPKLSVGVNVSGGDEGTEFVTRYRLLDNVMLEGTSSARKSGASINYTLEIE